MGISAVTAAVLAARDPKISDAVADHVGSRAHTHTHTHTLSLSLSHAHIHTRDTFSLSLLPQLDYVGDRLYETVPMLKTHPRLVAAGSGALVAGGMLYYLRWGRRGDEGFYSAEEASNLASTGKQYLSLCRPEAAINLDPNLVLQ